MKNMMSWRVEWVNIVRVPTPGWEILADLGGEKWGGQGLGRGVISEGCNAIESTL